MYNLLDLYSADINFFLYYTITRCQSNMIKFQNSKIHISDFQLTAYYGWQYSLIDCNLSFCFSPPLKSTSRESHQTHKQPLKSPPTPAINTLPPHSYNPLQRNNDSAITIKARQVARLKTT